MLDPLDRALALRSAPLLSALPATALLPVAALCAEVALDPAEVLFEGGDLGDSLYVVVRGQVAVERDGAVLALLGPGECVGEMAALDREPRSATVVAQARTLLIRVDRDDLLDLLVDHPALLDGLISVMGARLRRRPL